MDLSMQVHGEANSLYDMVFACLECGKVHQARKLVETPGLRAINTKLDQRCRRLRDAGKAEELANLVSVTKDILDIDRDMLYLHLLKAYVQQKDPDRAVGVWTTMQEDDHQPSDDFLNELGEFLQSSGREVPFAVPKKSSPPQQVVEPPSSIPESSYRAQFRQALQEKNWTSALDLKKKVEESRVRLSILECSELVEGLVQGGLLDEAAATVLSMVAAGHHPIPRVFKFFLMTLAGAGKVEPMRALQRYIIDHNLKRRLSYDNLLCTAHVAAGLSRQVLEDLAKTIRDAPDTGLQEVAENFPRGGILGILEKHPDCLPKVLEIAEQYAARGLVDPANCVWMHLFFNGQRAQADEIYQKHLKNSSSMLMFRGILKHAEKTRDAALLHALLQVLESHPGISSQAKGLVYSSWINMLSCDGKFEEGQQVVDTALKTLHLTDLSVASLEHLKKGLENAGKAFPYTIPSKENRGQKRAQAGSSSSSDSD